MLITPERAEEWLQKNTGNRPLNAAHITSLACAILDGEWQLNGESIKLGRGGRVLDGQHRLHAVLEARTAIQSLVAIDLPEEVQDSIDLGRKRTNGDALAMEGVANGARVAATIRILDAYWEGNLHLSRKLSPAGVKEILRANPDIEEACRIPSTKLINPSCLCAFHVLTSRLNAALATEFVAHITKGAPTPNPLFAMAMEKLIALRGKDTRAKGFLLLAKAWNYTRQGKTVSRITEPTETFIQLV